MNRNQNTMTTDAAVLGCLERLVSNGGIRSGPDCPPTVTMAVICRVLKREGVQVGPRQLGAILDGVGVRRHEVSRRVFVNHLAEVTAAGGLTREREALETADSRDFEREGGPEPVWCLFPQYPPNRLLMQPNHT